MKRSDALCKEVKERYEAEMRRKTELNNMASITVGLIPILIGALAYFFNNLPENSDKLLFFFFWFFLILSIILVVLCLVGFFRHQIGYKYAYVSDPDVLQQYEEEFINSMKNDRDELVNYDLVNAEMENTLHEQRVEATKINIECNELKISRVVSRVFRKNSLFQHQIW